MRRYFAFAVLVVSVVSFSASGQQGLLVDVQGRNLPGKGAMPETVLRSRPVLIDDAMLPTAATRIGQTVRLNLFDDVTLDVALESLTTRSSARYTWAGRIVNDEFSSVTIAVADDVVQANVHSPMHGNFQLRYTGDGLHQVHEVNPAEYPPCSAGPAQRVAPAPAVAGQPQPPVPRGTGNLADGLVVYTKSARTAVGGTAAIQALIDLAITESNDAYDFSLVDFEINLVGTFEVGYVENNGFSAALNALSSTTDGVMDEVHAAREAVGADFVSLIVNDGSSCGIGYIMLNTAGNFSGSAFSVNHYGCATGNFTFSHELGHNMGAAHDLGQTPEGGLFPDSLGWHWGNSSMPGYNGDYRTIMAYAPGARVQRFSNPNVSHLGGPTGSLGVADNARTLNITAPLAANWRQRAAWITVLPQDGVNSIGDEGGPFPSITFNLRNLDNTSANWTASSNQPWATLSSGAGTLGIGATTNVTVNFGAAANALAPGLYTAAITFADTTNAKIFQYNVRLLSRAIASKTVQYYYSMDTNPGWTPAGLWQFGVPLGLGTTNRDPTHGYTGANVYGYNLAGDYPNNMTALPLTTTAINCSQLDDVGLRFRRWLGVEESIYDQARIQVSNNGTTWTDVWVHSGGAIAETAWSEQSYDISAVANGRSTVYVRWLMGASDSSVTYSGWNLDDIAITGNPLTPTSANDIWVNPAYPGVERGTQPQPYSSLDEGMPRLNPGGTLHIVSSAIAENRTFDEPMTITAEGGAVTIGTP